MLLWRTNFDTRCATSMNDTLSRHKGLLQVFYPLGMQQSFMRWELATVVQNSISTRLFLENTSTSVHRSSFKALARCGTRFNIAFLYVYVRGLALAYSTSKCITSLVACYVTDYRDILKEYYFQGNLDGVLRYCSFPGKRPWALLFYVARVLESALHVCSHCNVAYQSML